MSKTGFYNAAESAIDDLFSDSSVSARKTLNMLEDLRANIDIKIEALKAALKRERAGR